MKCPATDLYPELAQHYLKLWQTEWDGCYSNELHSVRPQLGCYSVTHLSRRDTVILRRLRIGHTRATHKYLLSADSQLLCNECKSALTVRHILLECYNLKNVREKYVTCSSLKEVFENVDVTSIIAFIKVINFYHLL